MAVIRNLVVKIAADIGGLSKGLKEAQSKLLGVSNKLSSIGTKLTLGITTPLMMLAKQALDTSGQFEQSMANAASVAGATGDELQKMTDLAREMGKNTVFSASDAADAMYYMASAGYKVEQMANAIEPILNLASATQNDLAFATDTVIATLNQFQLDSSEAGRVSNVFASAIGYSQATLDKLGYSLSYVGPVANSLGWELESTVGALSVLYNAGYDGSMAGTSLRQSLVALMNPTASAKRIFEELGLELKDLDPTTNDFADIVDRLKNSGMSTAQAMEVFGARAGPGMMALLAQGGQAIRDATEAITGTNSAAEMAEKQVNTMQGSAKLMKSMFEEIAITIGNILIPLMRELMDDYVMSLLHKFDALSQSSKELIVKIGMVAAALGPAFLILSKVVKLVAFIPKILSVVTGPVGIIVAVIGLVAVALVKLYKTNDEFRTQIQAVWGKIQSAIVTATQTIRNWWNNNAANILETTKRVFGQLVDFIGAVIVEIIKTLSKLGKAVVKFFKENDKLKNAIKTVWDSIGNIITGVISFVKSFWDEYGDAIVQSVIEKFTLIMNVLATVVEFVMNLITTLVNGISRLWNSNESFRVAICNIWTAISTFIKNTIAELKAFWDAYGQAIFEKAVEIFSKIWDVICSVFSQIVIAVEEFCGYLTPIWEQLKALFLSLWDVLCELYELLKPVIDLIVEVIVVAAGVITGVLHGLIGALGPLIQAVLNVAEIVTEVVGAIVSLLRGDLEGAKEHLLNSWGSLKDFFSNLWQAILNLGKGFVDGFLGFFSNFGIDFVAEVKKICSTVGGWFSNLWQGIKDTAVNIWNTITGIFSDIGKFFQNLFKDAVNWGKNLISCIVDGIKSGIEWLGDTVKSIGQKIKNFLGFGSPTKEGPCSTADEWIPNLYGMMVDDLKQGLPDIEGAVSMTAETLASVGIAPGLPLHDDEAMFNGLYSALAMQNGVESSERPIELSIDGQVFARLIVPSLTKEYKRSGVVLEAR